MLGFYKRSRHKKKKQNFYILFRPLCSIIDISCDKCLRNSFPAFSVPQMQLVIILFIPEIPLGSNSAVTQEANIKR